MHCRFASKHATRELIDLFDVEVSGDRGRYIQIDMTKAASDFHVSRLFKYFFRVELDNKIKKEEGMEVLDDLLVRFESEFRPHSDLFQVEFGISLEVYIELFRYIAESLK